MQRAIGERIGDEAREVDIDGWMARTTLEMLGQAGLGYSFDNFQEDSADHFGESLKNFLYVASFQLSFACAKPLNLLKARRSSVCHSSASSSPRCRIFVRNG